jgi:hypothetical protein
MEQYGQPSPHLDGIETESPRSRACFPETFLHLIGALKHCDFEKLWKIKHRPYTVIFHAVIAEFPFLISHGSGVLKYPRTPFPIKGSDLSACVENTVHVSAKSFVTEKRSLLSEQSLLLPTKILS